VLIDLFSRRVVGWSVSRSNDTKFAQTALVRALKARRPRRGLLHHTDRGSPYTLASSSPPCRARTIQIARIGRYQGLDAQGCIVKLASTRALVDPWLAPVQAVTAAYVGGLRDALHSVDIRGSLVKGQGVADYSDIDSFAVVRDGYASEQDDAWTERVEQQVMQRFPHVKGVELWWASFADATRRDGLAAFIIKTEAACVHGEDLDPRIPGYRIGPEIAFQTRYFVKHLAQFHAEYPTRPADERPDFIVWMMRRFVRLGMELVMEAEQRFARDLYLCYESFAKHYPAQQAQMYRAMELALNPEASPDTEAFIRDFGAWLEARATERLASP
jgi:hypothetical protein